MTVEEYLANFSGITHERLTLLRSMVTTIAPEAVESFSYGLVGYKLHKKPLIYFGGFEHHTGLYATPNAHEAFKKEFAPYKQGKGSVQFPHDQPLPVELIEKVIRYRVEACSK